jgi:3-oxoacyl-[acyl-carrier protein] reductase
MSASRTAVVTGASGAIGAAIAETLGAEGFRVFVHYRNGRDSAHDVVKRITGSGGWAVAIRADISRRDEVAALFAEVERQSDSVDYLVNNAGITRDSLLPFLSDEQWDEVIDTNLRGTYLCSQLALSGMMRLRRGAICNIVSPSRLRKNWIQSAVAPVIRPKNAESHVFVSV